MAQLSQREHELVAIGAAMGSNCIPCIEYHIPEAKKAGLSDEELSEAILLADKVRKVPARKVLEAADHMLGGDIPGE
ncbi:carboxymuconolactone decarboxylase family protein [Microbulbifer yueqingensis]|uniref:4-carboxymuconolactone decarboxylase n=1 Tax=Microbulbifer yueqingensis TaxID=658219 RepID=A0A1G8V929_9GAMM|nr:carboxymuconolactone decarboxylase family protein [Microbulbifer yueqingensis]SDJ62367.1 4-carboxymuconolactone decarboxylase [Microbulbifer yueqingensis]